MLQTLVTKPELGDAEQERDPLFLFLCQLEWRERHDVSAYQELVAALDDANEEIRALAEDLLRRVSPRRWDTPKRNSGWNDL